MLKFWDNHGILGINARNLLYIKPYNKKSGIRFADDKLKTKQYLSARGIKVPRLIAKVSSEDELKNFQFSTLPSSFVLKPNSGFGGEGIVVTMSREDMGWVDTKGELLTQEYLHDHVSDIIDGKYSISGSRDTAFFEQRLVSHPDMGILGKYGLPDIRVIVYNMVPVMAMLRIPTAESGGKANMMLGGLGAGIDLAKGEITHLAQYNHLFKKGTEWDEVRGMKIPMWNEVLLTATRIQTLVTLGYLAVDIVLDEASGPTLLEINARAGLKVQVANLAPLRDRLDRVSGVKVTTPEKGVRMAQDLFGNKIEREVEQLTGKHVIGLEDTMTLNLKHGTKELLARVNPNVEKNYLDKHIFKAIAMSRKQKDKAEKLTLNYSLAGIRGKTIFYPRDMKGKKHQAIIGPQILKGFLVDISHTPAAPSVLTSDGESAGDIDKPKLPQFVANTKLLKLDSVLAELDRHITLVSALRPLNLATERKKFFASDTYEPQFSYKPVTTPIEDMRTQLLSLSSDGSALGQILEGKRKALLQKLALIDALGDDDAFVLAARELWNYPPQKIVDMAFADIEAISDTEDGEKSFSDEDACEQFRAYLKNKGLMNWEVKIKEGIVARCTIGKNNRLLIRKGELFSEYDIKKLIAHEIETHIFCTENGKLQPYQVFQRGFGNYLRTQEGLAVYHQAAALGDANKNAILGLLAVEWSKERGFRAVFDMLRKYLLPDDAWKVSVKAKRGLLDSGRTGGFTKNALYYWGWKEVEQYLADGGEYSRLYLGKVSLEQLVLVDKMEGLIEPRFIRKR